MNLERRRHTLRTSWGVRARDRPGPKPILLDDAAEEVPEVGRDLLVLEVRLDLDAPVFTLARESFASEYDAATVKRWLRVFFERFMTQQFKRTTLPPGPKVGTVSLSPRGDWRMPDEAGAYALVREIDALDTTEPET